jgi:hypothetical protein
MSWAGHKTRVMRLTLLTLLAAAPVWAAAGNEPFAAVMPTGPAIPAKPPLPAACAQDAPDTPPGSARCVVWLAAEAHSPATSFDRLSAPVLAQTSQAGAASDAGDASGTNQTAAQSARLVTTLGAQNTERLSFQGIPLGLWFTGLVVLAYALRRCERVWPQTGGTPGATKTTYLSTEAGRL